MSEYLSGKGVKYILAPKRGAWTTINPDVSEALTAKGQSNWIGTFISPDIASIKREPVQGGGESNENNSEGWSGVPI